MKIISIQLFLFTMILTSCYNSSKNNIVIDEMISNEVSINIIDTLKNQRSCSYNFVARSDFTSFINDTLFIPPTDTIRFQSYRASWIQNKDTILILGNDSRPDGTIGFNAHLIGDKINVFGHVRTHILLSNLSNEPNGKMYNSILIPTKEQKLIISKVPEHDNDIINGYIEFETKNFYVFENDENEKPVVEDKIRFIMKLYFKASKCGNE